MVRTLLHELPVCRAGGEAQRRLDLGDSLVKWSAHHAYNVAPLIVIANGCLDHLRKPGYLLVGPRRIRPGLAALGVLGNLVRSVDKNGNREPLYRAYGLG